ncbi:MAG: 30S ribosomal protein S2 [Candidatus Aminicenantes bacterium]
MISINMKELLEAGVHFGHQTRRWNPKMKDYIFGQRNGIYIIDLQKTIKIFKEAAAFISRVVEDGRPVLFVGTKKQAQDIIHDYAEKCEACYVNQRWLGGLLTNFGVIRGSAGKLIELEEMREDGRWDLLSKKEQSKLDKVYKKLQKNLGGIKNMTELPGVLFVIDSIKEDIAIAEARKLKIPIVAVVDTNGDPDSVDYPIPGNDDALRAIELFTSKIAEAVIEAKKSRLEKELMEAEKEKEEAEEAEEEKEIQEEESKEKQAAASEKKKTAPEEEKIKPAEKKEPKEPKKKEPKAAPKKKETEKNPEKEAEKGTKKTGKKNEIKDEDESSSSSTSKKPGKEG